MIQKHLTRRIIFEDPDRFWPEGPAVRPAQGTALGKYNVYFNRATVYLGTKNFNFLARKKDAFQDEHPTYAPKFGSSTSCKLLAARNIIFVIEPGALPLAGIGPRLQR